MATHTQYQQAARAANRRAEISNRFSDRRDWFDIARRYESKMVEQLARNPRLLAEYEAETDEMLVEFEATPERAPQNSLDGVKVGDTIAMKISGRVLTHTAAEVVEIDGSVIWTTDGDVEIDDENWAIIA